jgi:hypothetical protein
LQANLSVGPLVELQTAADPGQLGFASGFLSWATSRIARQLGSQGALYSTMGHRTMQKAA